MQTIFALSWIALTISADSDVPELPVTKLTIQAAAPSVPVLRYELLPNYREKVPGNAALSYHRAMLLKGEQREADPRGTGMRDRQMDEMAAKPTNELKIEELRTYLSAYRLVLRELENGSKRERCDWDLERRIDADGIGVLLPEVQKMRELARLLNLRCLLHIAEGKLEDALHDVQIGFAMARHVGEGPTMIQSLVGMAFLAIFAEKLERIISAPQAPNLYWSVTALPRPFFDMRRPLEGEMRSLEGTLPMLRDLEKGSLTVEQAQKMLEQWAQSLGQIGGGEERVPSRFILAGLVALHQPNARKSLLMLGKKEADVNAMPAAQVVLLDSLIRFKSMRDEMFIWFNMPYLEARQGLANANAKFRRLRETGAGDLFQNGLLMLLPAVDKVHFASVRSERRIAALRTIEALRLHAAETGRFPDQLADVHSVPVPVDPVTNRAFVYERTADGKALLSGPPPQGETAHLGNAFKYELALRK